MPEPEPTPDLEPSPCPFCGGENIALGFNRYGAWCVCVRCDATGPIAPHGPNDDPANAMRAAVEAWNRRSPLIAAAPDLLAACEAFMEARAAGRLNRFELHQAADDLARAALAKARPPEAR